MSDIPSYIMIRKNSDSFNNDAASVEPFDEVMDLHEQQQQDQCHEDNSELSLSQHDITEMKQMIQDIGHNPQILREKCGIPPSSSYHEPLDNDHQDQEQEQPPQLSNSMAIKYQQWVASEEEQEYAYHCDYYVDNNAEEEGEGCDGSSSHASYCYSHDGKLTSFRPRARSYHSNDSAAQLSFLATPPRIAKNKQTLSSSLDSTLGMTMASTTTLSLSMHGSSMASSMFLLLPPLPLFDSYICQECNSSSDKSQVNNAVSSPPLVSKEVVRSLMSTTTVPFDSPMVVAMARSA